MGSSFSWSPISDPTSDVEADLCLISELECLELDLALLLALELLGVLVVLGVLLACKVKLLRS